MRPTSLPHDPAWLLSLQELTPDALRRLDAAGLARLLPQRAVRPDTNSSGLGVLARAPLRAVAPRGPRSEARLEVALSPRGGPALRVVAVHPLPPVSQANTRAWVAALRALPGPRAGAVARVLVGDFNATLDHREMHRLLVAATPTRPTRRAPGCGPPGPRPAAVRRSRSTMSGLPGRSWSAG